MTSTSTPPGLARFNALEEHAALAVLHEVCASTAWARRLLAGRPYATAGDLYAAGDAATAGLTAADLDEAMAGHPPIGRPRPGDAVSAREQSGMTGASDALRAELLDLNLAYQEKFGHVFLVCATGRTGEQMRDAVKERIGNAPEREREIVRTELGKINRIRLARLVEGDRRTMSTETTASVSTHILDTSAGRPAGGVAVHLHARSGRAAHWQALGGSATDEDGRCRDLPALPEGTTHVRLDFAVEAYFEETAEKQADAQQDAPANRDGGAPVFFPEVAVTFAVVPGEHYHVPLLLNPFGYSVYRGS
ncbi:2-oxo-4-hydroxy-4-carboxy-5-ureidoimidazoline decarboxylase [Streptomyces viridosporus]|uniref:2-oxo-4-hydroxy-4-carboxy-5-ureidoimidazoline decarboxylase n=1 Tax=Streptomyces viridosporus T7A TaxID=665577 RepID=A0ABX6ALF2_STRVD|nr:2-oxo-4-hydroxy-4-carboxy-5-ureidoimidazoline decarboxylase [Streptomyces viridosporus]QEU88481.1 2-oxo-4-hydroxy-4-carboxy-5-ureidoimidazoline decarboxylase [Streptomyces viridosporus T7A]